MQPWAVRGGQPSTYQVQQAPLPLRGASTASTVRENWRCTPTAYFNFTSLQATALFCTSGNSELLATNCLYWNVVPARNCLLHCQWTRSCEKHSHCTSGSSQATAAIESVIPYPNKQWSNNKIKSPPTIMENPVAAADVKKTLNRHCAWVFNWYLFEWR